jgi:hypothetical protein
MTLSTFKKRAIVVLVIFAVVLGLFFYLPRAYRGTEIVTILDKERINFVEDGKNKSRYLVFTDKEVYQNRDDWFYLKFHSSDIYGYLKRGEKYKISVTGWRMELFSKYQNIISAQRVVDHVATEADKIDK